VNIFSLTLREETYKQSLCSDHSVSNVPLLKFLYKQISFSDSPVRLYVATTALDWEAAGASFPEAFICELLEEIYDFLVPKVFLHQTASEES
jgi:hypothetical protein